jgi:hypothetical protein
MALEGACTYTKVTDTGEKELQEITHPDGSVTNDEVPVLLNEIIEYDYVYLIVKQITFFQIYFEGQKTQVCNFQIAAYNSVEQRNDNQEDWLFFDSLEIDFDYDLNVYEQIYNHIKTLEGYTNLINS